MSMTKRQISKIENDCNHINDDGSCAFTIYHDYNYIVCTKCNMVYELSDSISTSKPKYSQSSKVPNSRALTPISNLGIYNSKRFTKALEFIKIYKDYRIKRIYIRGRNFMNFCNHRMLDGESAVKFSRFGGFCSLCGQYTWYGITWVAPDAAKAQYLYNLHEARCSIRSKLYIRTRFKKYKAVKNFSRLCDNKIHGYRKEP